MDNFSGKFFGVDETYFIMEFSMILTAPQYCSSSKTRHRNNCFRQFVGYSSGMGSHTLSTGGGKHILRLLLMRRFQLKFQLQVAATQQYRITIESMCVLEVKICFDTFRRNVNDSFSLCKYLSTHVF